jgi:hypothetical protein
MGAISQYDSYLANKAISNFNTRSFQRKKFLASFVFLQKKLAVRAQRCETLLTLALVLVLVLVLQKEQ